MKIFYDTQKGNTEFVAKKLCEHATSIQDTTNLLDTDKVLLLTYTIGNGEIPKTTEAFLQKHGKNVCGVVSTGNIIRHPQTFGHAAVRISERLNVPVVRIVQLKGEDQDFVEINKWIEKNSL